MEKLRTHTWKRPKCQTFPTDLLHLHAEPTIHSDSSSKSKGPPSTRPSIAAVVKKRWTEEETSRQIIMDLLRPSLTAAATYFTSLKKINCSISPLNARGSLDPSDFIACAFLDFSAQRSSENLHATMAIAWQKVERVGNSLLADTYRRIFIFDCGGGLASSSFDSRCGLSRAFLVATRR